MNELDKWLMKFTADWRNPAGVAALLGVALVAVLYWEQTRFVLKSLFRNLLRTTLVSLATFCLVVLVTCIWSILSFLDAVTESKSKNLKAIVTERYQIPSQMPHQYAASLATGAPHKKGDYHVNPEHDSMLWGFYGGTLDPAHKTRDNIVFFFAMEPSKLLSVDAKGNYTSMMDEVDLWSASEKQQLVAACQEMQRYPNKVLIGPARLKALNKKVGERFKVTSLNYKDIDLEFEVMGELPGGRYEQSAVMNYDYLWQALQGYNKGKPKDQQHPMTDRTLALMWLRVPDTDTFAKIADQIDKSPDYTSPAVKCETASSGIASFLDAYKDLLWGMRWLMAPALIATLALVIATAISISVRARQKEMAILKVLGYSPNQILAFVLGEALVVGCTIGMLSGCFTWLLINQVVGGIALPIAFFGKFFINGAAPWWGLGIGAATAFAGSIIPAWSARSVKASEVFSKVT